MNAQDTIEDDFRMETVRNAIYEIFDTEKDRNMMHEKGLPKSCPPSSLLSRFCRQALKLEEWEEVRHLWRLFVQTLQSFWNEATSDEGDHAVRTKNNSRWYIPHTDSEIEWTSCLLEQKINMLNLCCLTHIDSLQNKKTKIIEKELQEGMNAWQAVSHDPCTKNNKLG
jgi:hypothetical protein